MQKVFDTYATRKGVSVQSLRFLLDGEKISPDATPKMLELDDQDQIDCMLEQVRLLRESSSILVILLHASPVNLFPHTIAWLQTGGWH